MSRPDPDFVPIIFCRLKEGGLEPDYAIPLNGPFDASVPLQALQQEAGAKACIVIVQAFLVPKDEYYQTIHEEEQESTDEQATE